MGGVHRSAGVVGLEHGFDGRHIGPVRVDHGEVPGGGVVAARQVERQDEGSGVRAAGIGIPIVPGVVCIQNFRQTSNFARKTGASVPDWLGDRFAGLENDPATHQLVAAGIAAEQVLDLVDQGIRDFHFYTMNRAELVYAICRLLGLKSEDERAAA